MKIANSSSRTKNVRTINKIPDEINQSGKNNDI